MAAEIWVCATCRSVNRRRAKQCYQCRTPRDRAAVDPSTISASSRGQVREVALPDFHSSRGIAVVASVLIVAVAILEVIVIVVTGEMVEVLLGNPQAYVDLETAAALRAVSLGVVVLALVAWSFWLSLTVRAMPALGLGYPPSTGLTAFLENFVPFLNLLRVPSIVRDIVHRLEPSGGRGDGLIFAAWIGLFAGFALPRAALFLNIFAAETEEQAIRNQLSVQGIATVLVSVGAIFLVGLIWWIEGRIATRRAEQLAAAAARPALDPRAQQETPALPAPGAAASGAPPAPPAPAAPAAPAASSTGPVDGPYLEIRVQPGGMMTASLDGEPPQETSLEELREAAPALGVRRASATILHRAGDAPGRSQAIDLSVELEMEGVTTKLSTM